MLRSSFSMQVTKRKIRS